MEHNEIADPLFAGPNAAAELLVKGTPLVPGESLFISGGAPGDPGYTNNLSPSDKKFFTVLYGNNGECKTKREFR